MVVDVSSEGVHASDQQPQPDAELAAINQQRVCYIALRQHKRLRTWQPARNTSTGTGSKRNPEQNMYQPLSQPSMT